MLLDRLEVFRCEPHNDLLVDRPENGAYCTAEPGRQYAVYFPQGQPVGLDVGATGRLWRVQWLDVDGSLWAGGAEPVGGGTLRLEPPHDGQWVALLEPHRSQ